ncbi:DUF1461 domain-containing protein [Agaribacterium sp. ZY112]|uniref:lipoprotein intramolecular transacylase Lit n=1 Tax=Agaribacterium sp. ZY112 TaxID=3233574 RepID=UPI003523A0BD
MLILAFSVSWVALAKVDFLYPLWHDHTGIASGIERFAPQNRYKQGFAETSAEQRYQLFAEINRSVHQHGEGLTEISYETATSHGKQALLRDAEVVHLEDVAKLIDRLTWLVLINVVVLSLMVWLFIKRSLPLPSIKQCLLGNAFVFTALALALIFIGPTQLFYLFHIWVFPKEHQWFFYYQDSLMSTMMLAPVLFGWIAAAWVFLSCLLLPCFILLLRLLTKKA